MKIALGITGCIAAYKSVEVMRGLQKAGASVQVIMTRSARRFVGALTFEALSGKPVITDLFRRNANKEILHIRAAQEADLLAVVPATANALAKFAHGIADDCLSTIYVSCPAPVLLAPAMNVEMWNHPSVKANIETLKARGHCIVDPESGPLACGAEGEGRLAPVDVIIARVFETFRAGRDLAGLRVLVTAGPTVEDIDPVRYISNRSSGKMGYAVAGAARRRGAEVWLISGPTNLAPPPDVHFLPVRSADEMKRVVLRHFGEADIVVKAAAVADYRPAEASALKTKKGASELTLRLVPTDDILALLGKEKRRQVLVGFAAETHNILAYARDKLQRKNLDLVVANDVSRGVFGEDTAAVQILDAGGREITLSETSKLEIANRILDEALQVLVARRDTPASR